MQELVSIIVPVYKVKEYLPKCVDSLLEQTYKNIEIILVDDGSPDVCGKICDDYAVKDNRVTVIHKENGGLSDARNIAIPKAYGEYIVFVDSDDWVSQYYVEHLYEAIKKDDVDLAFSWFENVYEGQDRKLEVKKELSDYECLDSQSCLKRLLYQDGVECCAWGKIYKKEIISGLRYPVGKLYEDIPVTYECIKRSSKIAVISNVDYYYVQRNASIQYQSFNPNKLDGVTHCHDMLESVRKDFPDLVSAAECRYFSTVCNILFQINDDEYEKERQNLWMEVKKYRMSVLVNFEARIKARAAAAISYLGLSTMSIAYKKTQFRGRVVKNFH